MPLDEADALSLLRLAGWLSDPAGWYRAETGLDEGLRGRMADSAMLRPELNRWLAQRAGLADCGVGPAFVAGASRNPSRALALGLLMAGDEVLDRAARLLGGAVIAERLRKAVLRDERQRLAEALGGEAVEFGLRRAPIFAPSLAALPLAEMADAAGAGLALCGSVIAGEGERLFALFRLRRPDVAGPVALTARQVAEVRAVLSMQGVLA